MLFCTCGYSCGTRLALERHFEKQTGSSHGDGLEHQLDPRGEATILNARKRSLSDGTASTPLAVAATSSLPRRSATDCAGSPTPTTASTFSPVSSVENTPMAGMATPRSRLARTGAFAMGPTPALNTLSESASGSVRLLLIRHGESGNKHRLPGQKASADPCLSALGERQADALADRLAKELGSVGSLRKAPSKVHVVSSPMQRCLLTIRPTVRKLALAKDKCSVHGACFEFGCAGKAFSGSSSESICHVYSEFTPVGFSRDGFWDYHGEHERETEEECRARGSRIVSWLVSEAVPELRRAALGTPKKSAGAVGLEGGGLPLLILCIHQTVSDLLLHILLEGSSADWSYGEVKYRLANTGITEVMLREDGRATMSMQNDDKHLVHLLWG
eukprot:TRINITY_DN16596_c0_g1_i1.p1 TRINITY_DN16596_c0_g1~~TRINITY_DN16596_c0_g1_i1.p1  ORF type:complete len:389 (+),score=56.34 TRINITY_DN16596_c0_g1_i1:158-1324(+)